MKVILQQDVTNVGREGETHEVAPGYFRNYLQPRGLAAEATKGLVRSQQARSVQQKDRASREREQAEKSAQSLNAVVLTFPVKVGEQGRLFGSITARDIAEELERAGGMKIDRHKITLKDPLRSLGEHEVTLRLAHGVEGRVRVDLVPESQEGS